MEKQYTLEELLYLMRRLRDPVDGCPWDKRQDFDSIVPHTIEEACEVAEAIEKKDYSHIREELGDLLFQVVFYCQLGQELGHFDFASVVHGIVEKLIRRHPHVFPDKTLASRLAPGQEVTEQKIRENWERIKAEERAEKAAETRGEGAGVESILDQVSNALPTLVVAEKMQHKAASLGFDWDDINPVFEKLDEELDELEAVALGQEPVSQEYLDANRKEIEHELGDVLFCCVNIARFLSVKPDQALRKANHRFRQRFGHIEKRLQEQGGQKGQASLEEMEAWWQEAKQLLKEKEL
ncbi:MAG: nucleoside triphosphate pyrophosphohydrolase [Proteobacteria bacterium]|nr:MAG: nucleoside triphosphate pyrophosphohydrolase [Pseudomonadota bacterium]PIE40421.1 MAG: nucleoside triphosphate pyrophosphohydrolase [Gammaproteobacteria bacterium]